MDTLELLVTGANSFLWGYVLIGVLLLAGVVFTVATRFIQIRHFFHTFGVMRNSFKSDGGVSSFGAYCTSLAARVGTANIAGVAIAITAGGPGAIFWMWVTAVLGMATAFIESTLAQAYKIKNPDGTFRGGPAFYIERGLGSRRAGILFSLCLMVSFGFIFNAVQSNSMAVALDEVGWGRTWITAIVLVVVTSLIIFGGIRRIATFAELVVPIMAIAYLGVASYTVLSHIDALPSILALIFREAFNFDSALGGGLGFAIMTGVRRGLFSNEAGVGSAPNAAATADVKHPAMQGYVQMLGVFTDTVVICTCTAAMILMSPQFVMGTDATGVHLTQLALSSAVGDWGSFFIAVALIFFAFTSIVANYYYGETAIAFFTDSRWALQLYRFVVLAMIVFGCLQEAALVWEMGDLFMGVMAAFNLGALVLLARIGLKIMRDYNRQLHEGKKEPTFDPSNFPELAKGIDHAAWPPLAPQDEAD